MWSPFLCAVALAVMQPTNAEIEQQQEEAVKQVPVVQDQQQQQQLFGAGTTLAAATVAPVTQSLAVLTFCTLTRSCTAVASNAR